MQLDHNTIKTLLKDTILLDVHQEKLHSSIIITLDGMQQSFGSAAKATVLRVGSKFRHKDDISIGDLVLVPSQFGTKVNSLIPSLHEDVRIFDGEDILARLDP